MSFFGVLVRQRSDKYIKLIQVLGDVMSLARDQRFVKHLQFTTRLGIVRGCCEVP